MSNLTQLENSLSHYKSEIIDILNSRYSDEEIKKLCIRFQNAPDESDLFQELRSENHPEWCCSAIISLCSIMFVQKKFPFSSKSPIPIENAAELILNGMHAMLCLQDAAYNPLENKAIIRLKQLKNQPNTRTRNNVERDDIEVRMDNYLQEKGIPPTCLNFFLEYLESLGYKIDEACRTVNAPVGSNIDWKRPRSFSTIEKWLQEFRNQYMKNFPAR